MSKGADFDKTGLKIRKGFFILLKIILSFDNAAFYVIWLKFLQLLFFPADYLFYFFEKISFRKEEKPNVPIVFVVGIQRTGSTLISQFIEKTFPFFPVGNFNAIFKRSRFYLHKWLSWFYKKPTESYQNFYGISKGFYSIGDCYELWDRWFGKNHYVLPEQLNEFIQKDLVLYFSSLYEAYKKPILTKNNRNSLLLPFFNKAFKNALFIIVRRNPVAVIRSTIEASKDFFGKEGLLWGLYPNSEFDTNNYENLIESATVQFLMLNKILNEQIKELNEGSYLMVDYDEFCANPKEFQENLFKMLKAKSNFNLSNIIFRDEPFKTSKRLDNQEVNTQIRAYLDKWENKI